MPNKKKINVPSKSEELAEFIGIMLGDGNIYVGKKSIFQISVAGNSEKEKEFMLNFVKNRICNLFNVIPEVRFHKTLKGIALRVNSKLLAEFLFSMGLKSGSKTKNQVSICDWIWSDTNFLKACVRGLIDTDGSLYKLKPHWPNLYQLSFKAYNEKLLKDVREAFILLGFHPSKIFDKRIVITRQDEIRKYFKEIGTNNLKYSPVV